MAIANQWYSDLRRTKTQVKNILKPILNLFSKHILLFSATLEVCMKLLKELLLLKGWFIQFKLWCSKKVQTWEGRLVWKWHWEKKKQGIGRSLMESHNLWDSAMWVSWNHFLTSLAFLKRSCGWTVCLGWETTSKLVPLLIISAKKLKFRLFKDKTTLAHLEALIEEQYKEMPDVPWRFPSKLLDVLRDSKITFR